MLIIVPGSRGIRLTVNDKLVDTRRAYLDLIENLSWLADNFDNSLTKDLDLYRQHVRGIEDSIQVLWGMSDAEVVLAYKPVKGRVMFD